MEHIPGFDAELRELSRRVAQQLVAQHLREIIGGQAAIDVTIQPAPPERKLLPPARETKRRGRPRKAQTRHKPGPQRKPGRPHKAGRPHVPATSVSGELAGRRCRKCYREGTGVRVVGSERTLKCTACGHTWDLRLKATERAASFQAPRPEAHGCKAEACGHPRRDHVDFTGQCIARGCKCQGFV